MLTLPIKKKWFDMIASGEKKEEYREIKPYYDSRFMNAFGFLLVGGQMVYGDAAPKEIRKPWPVPIVFRNGYSEESPEIICKCTLHFGKGKPEWGAEPGKLYYVLKIQANRERSRTMNKVILMGRLTRDPEVRYTQGEQAMAVARYTLAVDRRGKNQENSADFIQCVAFGKAGEFAERYLHKGTKTIMPQKFDLKIQ